MDGGRFFHGLLLIAIGLLFLGVNLGYFDWGVLGNLWRYWPVLLILLGASVIFRRTFSWLVMIIVIAALVMAFWGGSAGTKEVTESFIRDLPAGATSGQVNLRFGAGRLTVGGASTGMAEGTFVSGPFTKPSLDFSGSAGKVSLTVKQKSGSFGDFNLGGRLTHRWDLKFTTSIPLDFDINAGACEADLDFSAYKVRSVEVDTGAASLTMNFGTLSPQTNVVVNAGASDITIKVPAAAGVRVTQEGGFSSNNLESLGWEKQGKTYVSPGYNAATSKIDIQVKTGASNLRVVKVGAGTTF